MPNRQDDIEKYVEKQFAEMATAEEMSRVIRDLPDLVASLESTDLCACLPLLSGLMTIPELQPNLIRLEALVHMVVARAEGKVQANRDLIEKWLNVDLAADILMRVEDPVEDVFVANVVTGGGNRRIFTGVWETPDFWLQSLIDVLSVAPRTPQLQRIRAETDALLKLSEAVAERTRASRFSISKGTPYVQISLPSETDLLEIASRCRFNPGDLNDLGIRRELLGPFVFDIESREQLEAQKVGESGLQPFGDLWRHLGNCHSPSCCQCAENLCAGGGCWIRKQLTRSIRACAAQDAVRLALRRSRTIQQRIEGCVQDSSTEFN